MAILSLDSQLGLRFMKETWRVWVAYVNLSPDSPSYLEPAVLDISADLVRFSPHRPMLGAAAIAASWTYLLVW